MHGSITDDVVVTCDQIVDTPKSPAISLSDYKLLVYCCYLISNGLFPNPGGHCC